MNGDYGPEEAAMQAYLRDGERRAMALGNRGPIRFTPTGELHPGDRRGLLALRLLRLRGRAPARRARRHRARPARHAGPPAGRAGAPVDAQGPAGARRRTARGRTCSGRSRSATRWAAPALANGRHPVKMYRAERRGRRAEGGRLPDPGLAAVLRGVRCASTAIPGCSRSPPRSTAPDFMPFNEALFDQGAGPRRLGRLAPGRLDALGQPRLGPGHPRLQLHGPALRLHRGQRRVGRAGLAQAGQGRHQGAGRRGRHRAAARRRADHLRAGRRRDHQPPGACTAPSPTPARTGG